MRLLSRGWGVLCVVALGSACAAARIGGSDRNVITREQILTNGFRNAYDAVQALHSNWLQTHGQSSSNSPTPVLVYLDNVLMGDAETLRSIETSSIVYIEHFDPNAASARWGIGHGQGVIYVSTRPKSPDSSS